MRYLPSNSSPSGGRPADRHREGPGIVGMPKPTSAGLARAVHPLRDERKRRIPRERFDSEADRVPRSREERGGDGERDENERDDPRGRLLPRAWKCDPRVQRPPGDQNAELEGERYVNLVPQAEANLRQRWLEAEGKVGVCTGSRGRSGRAPPLQTRAPRRRAPSCASRSLRSARTPARRARTRGLPPRGCASGTSMTE